MIFVLPKVFIFSDIYSKKNVPGVCKLEKSDEADVF
jgi:hypothetical protein